MTEDELATLAARNEDEGSLAPGDTRRLIAEVQRLRQHLHDQAVSAGPYMLLHWTNDIRHAEPCDCDLDEETAGERCMANSEWTYAVCVDGGAFAPRLILELPRRPPVQPDHDGPPLVAVPWVGDASIAPIASALRAFVADERSKGVLPAESTVSAVATIRPDGHGRIAVVDVDLLAADEDEWEGEALLSQPWA